MEELLNPQQELFLQTITNGNNKPCVYLVENQGYYKIGKASDIKSRMVSLQCGNPSELKLIAFLNCKNNKEEEKRLHRLLNDFKYSREWFKLPNSIIRSLKYDFYCNQNNLYA